MSKQHAILSASGVHRWLSCTPSARLELEFDDISGEAAFEGTAAHNLSEHKLRIALNIKSERPVSAYDSKEMENYTDGYVEFVLEALEEAKKKCKDPLILIEQRLDFSSFVPDGLEELKSERAKNKKLTATVSIQKQQIAEMEPKASYYDVVLNCKDAVAITTIAKDYGKSGRWLNEYLHDLGVQFRQGKIWLLYQKYAQHGYTATKTHSYPGSDGIMHSKIHTYWTQKGRLFIYELLKANGILPLIEQEF